jgi:diguanylate cyclase (GGDEF)-like protein
MQTWQRLVHYFDDVRAFMAALSAAIIIVVAAIFLFRYTGVRELLIKSVLQEAASYANLIMLTRHWNAQYGGVYVEKRPGVESNPYLREIGVEPDIRAAGGKVLTLRNPAVMTREISDLAKESNSIQFRLVSTRRLNPDNAPDAFEEEALKRFERKEAEEAWKLDVSGSAPVFRYVRPLFAEDQCLECHRRQGYKLGDVRGGISVVIPAERLMLQLQSNRLQITAVAVLTIGLLLAILLVLTWRLVTRLNAAQKQLKHIAVTDELTGLRNRRYIMEQLENEYQRAVRSGAPLALILLDIDHFKRINDSYGHSFGDQILKDVSAEMKSSLRSYDLLGRIGGEEFLIASPGSTLSDAEGLAERILNRIRNRPMGNEHRRVAVTLSAGVTSLRERDANAEAVFGRADAALYTAKIEGRDKVIVL